MTFPSNSLSELKLPDLSPWDPVAEAGRKILYFQFRKILLREVGAILGDHIEELHAMRIATRRMRTALNVFGEYFDPDVIKPFRIGLRKTAKALSQVRDLDVFIEKLEQYLDGLSGSERDKLEPLRVAWSQERIAARKKVLVYLERPKYLDFKLNFWDLLETPEAGIDPKQSHLIVQEVAGQLINFSLQEVFACYRLLNDPQAQEMHALRIAFKRHRYILEFFRGVLLGSEAKKCIGLLKKIQDHLGDIHDANLAAKRAGKYLRKSNWKGLVDLETTRALAAFIATKQSEETNLMATFPALWDQFAAQKYQQNLADALSKLDR